MCRVRFVCVHLALVGRFFGAAPFFVLSAQSVGAMLTLVQACLPKTIHAHASVGMPPTLAKSLFRQNAHVSLGHAAEATFTCFFLASRVAYVVELTYKGRADVILYIHWFAVILFLFIPVCLTCLRSSLALRPWLVRGFRHLDCWSFKLGEDHGTLSYRESCHKENGRCTLNRMQRRSLLS